MRIAKRILAAFLCLVALDGLAGPYTDLWWNPDESGWGMNLVQQEDVAFVTLFVYGADHRPLWYVGSNVRVVALNGADGRPTFSGDLYRTTGPYHGSPFDPASVTVTPVGRIWLTALDASHMTVEYEAEGVHVVKAVARQTWAQPIGGGLFHAGFALRQSTGGPSDVVKYSSDVGVDIDGSSGLLLVFEDNQGRRCEYRGAYAQAGKFGAMTGTFECTRDSAPAGSGSFELSELELTAHGVTGFLRIVSPDRVESGRFGGARLGS
ncbi:MAG TPA: hypothetical protein VLS49_08335 [Usitatibacter sp.]|nr:hypothetical protein [Usitatibacter sp.]